MSKTPRDRRFERRCTTCEQLVPKTVAMLRVQPCGDVCDVRMCAPCAERFAPTFESFMRTQRLKSGRPC